MYVKLYDGITVEDVKRLSVGGNGHVGFLSENMHANSKMSYFISNLQLGRNVSVEEVIERFLNSKDPKLTHIGVYKATTGVRGYYRTVVLGK